MTPPRKWARVPAPGRIEEWLAAEHERVTSHPIKGGRLLHWRAMVWFACRPGLDVRDAELYSTRRPRPGQEGFIGDVLAGQRRLTLYVRQRRLRSPRS